VSGKWNPNYGTFGVIPTGCLDAMELLTMDTNVHYSNIYSQSTESKVLRPRVNLLIYRLEPNDI
jgi:hypothetical protein